MCVSIRICVFPLHDIWNMNDNHTQSINTTQHVNGTHNQHYTNTTYEWNPLSISNQLDFDTHSIVQNMIIYNLTLRYK